MKWEAAVSRAAELSLFCCVLLLEQSKTGRGKETRKAALDGIVSWRQPIIAHCYPRYRQLLQSSRGSAVYALSLSSSSSSSSF